MMRVLVIAAHMDDEVLGPGGTVVRHVENGDQVFACIVTKRAYNHRYEEDAIAIERHACLKAAGILGYSGVHFLDLKDELLDHRIMDIITPLENIIQDVRPDTVYTHHHGDLNQDHRAVNQASMVACRALATPMVKRLLTFETLSSSEQAPKLAHFAFLPNFWVDISNTLVQKKEALRQYHRELRDFPHPRSAEGLEIQAKMRGMEAGMPAAEAFHIVRDLWQG